MLLGIESNPLISGSTFTANSPLKFSQSIHPLKLTVSMEIDGLQICLVPLIGKTRIEPVDCMGVSDVKTVMAQGKVRSLYHRIGR